MLLSFLLPINDVSVSSSIFKVKTSHCQVTHLRGRPLKQETKNLICLRLSEDIDKNVIFETIFLLKFSDKFFEGASMKKFLCIFRFVHRRGVLFVRITHLTCLFFLPKRFWQSFHNDREIKNSKLDSLLSTRL